LALFARLSLVLPAPSDSAAGAPESFEILVVCLGNVCRSPLAEHVLRMRIDELLPDGDSRVHVRSAGVRGLTGQSMDPHAAAELERLGGDASAFRARQLTGELATHADLVLTATRALRSRVLEEAPRALRRTFTIRELAAIVASPAFAEQPLHGAGALVATAASWRGSVTVEDYDIADPIGRSAEFHRAVADVLNTECAAIARAVALAVRGGVSQP
jgi:protein-tyrosine phosphatase